jgi:tetrapyrrole methylase family protein/MazG family protein/ATP diphosphatase
VSGSDEVLTNWEKIKTEEYGDRGVLAGLPRSYPALARAQRMSDKVSKVGFDWPDARGSRDKVSEELRELDEAVQGGSSERIESELGDVLFALVNFARHQGVNAELALRKTADRFAGRFAHVEARVKEQHGGFPRDKEGKPTSGLSLDTLDSYWIEAKERGL